MKTFALKTVLLVFFLSFLSCDNSSNDLLDAINDNNGDTTEEDNTNEEETNNSNNTAQTVVDAYGQLRIKGSKIVDKNDNAIQLRGMSLFWSQWMPQYYTTGTISWLKEDWNVTIVRAAMAVEDNDGYLSNPEREKAKIFTVIDAAIEQGIYVIVDWHSHHAENHLSEAKSFFAEVAQKYGDKPNIIYEIYNEPLDGVSWNNTLKPYHEAVIKEIRKYDPDNIVVCGTRVWSQRVDEVIGNEINDANVAYTLHYYAASHKQYLRDIAKQAIDNNLAIFVTEYGTTEYTGDGYVDTAESKAWWKFLDDNKISWCNWSIADKNEKSAALTPGASGNGNWSLDQVTESGKLVRTELIEKNPTF